jgi:hypothetical protein
MQNVVVSGATGFIGRRLVEALVARGDTVTALTRSPERARGTLPARVRLEQWDVDGALPIAAMSDADAVVHLAGERAVGIRWTRAVKQEILDSRVRSTERLVLAMERSAHRPRVLVSASGVGFYGASGSSPVDEQAGPGSDFLATVTVAWEAAASRAEALGVRVVRARFGIVIGRGGGALAEMVKPFQLFVGGPIASGKQMVSWVHLDDAVSALLRAIDDEGLRGAVNVTSPGAVANEVLASAIGTVLGRPSGLRVPEFALRLRFGEGAVPLVTGQNAAPRVLEHLGFGFRYPHIEGAIADALG